MSATFRPEGEAWQPRQAGMKNGAAHEGGPVV